MFWQQQINVKYTPQLVIDPVTTAVDFFFSFLFLYDLKISNIFAFPLLFFSYQQQSYI